MKTKTTRDCQGIITINCQWLLAYKIILVTIKFYIDVH